MTTARQPQPTIHEYPFDPIAGPDGVTACGIPTAGVHMPDVDADGNPARHADATCGRCQRVYESAARRELRASGIRI